MNKVLLWVLKNLGYLFFIFIFSLWIAKISFVYGFDIWNKEFLHIDCPADSVVPCINTYAECTHNAIEATVLYGCVDYQGFCDKSPLLCSQEARDPIPIGGFIGEKPPYDINNFMVGLRWGMILLLSYNILFSVLAKKSFL